MLFGLSMEGLVTISLGIIILVVVLGFARKVLGKIWIPLCLVGLLLFANGLVSLITFQSMGISAISWIKQLIVGG